MDQRALEATVVARLGYDPFRASAATLLSVTLSLAPEGEPGLRARIDRSDAPRGGASDERRAAGTRLLAATALDCRELSQTLALEIALAIDPFQPMKPIAPAPAAATGEPAPKATPEPAAGPVTPPPSVAGTAPAPSVRPSSAVEKIDPAADTAAAGSPRAPSKKPGKTAAASTAGNDRPPPIKRAEAAAGDDKTGVSVGAGALAAIGGSSTVGVGLTLRVALRRRWFSLALEGRGDLPSTVAAIGAQVATGFVMGTLAPCAHVSVFAACALLEAGAQIASVSSTGGTSTQEVAPYLAAGGRVALEIPWDIPRSGILAFLIHADLVAALMQSELAVGGVVVARTAPVAGAVGLAFLVRLR